MAKEKKPTKKEEEENATSFEYQEKKEKIDSYIASKHLYFKGKNLKPTFDGMMILDQILLDLID